MDSKAVAVLQKFGWVEGKGLGKSESGAVESIRVVRKSNTKGLGEKGAHWGNDWWDRMYTAALDNLDSKRRIGLRSSEENSEDPQEKLRKSNSAHHMDDASVFDACNGIILRKFVPTGKLERLAQQEQQWKEKLAQSSSPSTDSPVVPSNTPKKKSKKRKREVIVEEDEAPKKRRKKEKRESKEKKTKKSDKKQKKEKRKRNTRRKRRGQKNNKILCY